MEKTSGQVPCSYHKDIMTGLRCTRCGKPICPLDAIRTDVGLRCPDCAGVRSLGTIRTDSGTLVKSALTGLAVAIGTAILWRFWPDWQFYLAMLLGFGVAESIAYVSNNKRGRDLQFIGIAAVTLGLVLARFLLMQRYGIGWDQINALTNRMSAALQLRAIPDLLFAVMAYAIVWIRFR